MSIDNQDQSSQTVQPSAIQQAVQQSPADTPEQNPSTSPSNASPSDRIKGTFMEETADNKQQREAYNAGIMQMIYDPKTKASIYQMLKSGEPQTTIPQVVNMLNDKMSTELEQEGHKVDLGTSFNGIIFTTMELANLGTTGGFFNLNKDSMPPIIKSSLQQYVQTGLKNKTIDPIEVQQAAQSLMTPDEQAKGEALAVKNGYPARPGVQAAMDTYANKKVSVEKQKYIDIMNRMQQSQTQQSAQQNQQGPQQQQSPLPIPSTMQQLGGQ